MIKVGDTIRGFEVLAVAAHRGTLHKGDVVFLGCRPEHEVRPDGKPSYIRPAEYVTGRRGVNEPVESGWYWGDYDGNRERAWRNFFERVNVIEI